MEIKVSRRDFLRYGLAGTAMAVSLDPLGRAVEATGKILSAKGNLQDTNGLQLIPTSCTECAAGCGLLAVLQGDRLVEVIGNPVHPVNRGRLCGRLITSLNLIYDPDRVLTPRQRKGEDLVAISWDEATKLLSARLDDLAQQNRPQGLAWVINRRYVSAPVSDFISAWENSTIFYADQLEDFTPVTAYQLFWGQDGRIYDFKNARTIFSFGANPFEDHAYNVSDLEALVSARMDNGARLITFDPRLTNTAGKSDEWHPINPGAYGFLALTMARLIWEENRADAEFLNSYLKEPLPEIKSALNYFTPERAAQVCGIKETEITRLAREFAARRPALAVSGPAVWQCENGVAQELAILFLNAVVGNIDREGGIIRPRDEEIKKFLRPPVKARPSDASLWQEYRQQGEPISLMICYRANPAFHVPGGLTDKNRPFQVVIDTHLSETARQADLFLPCTTAFEQWGLITGTLPNLNPFVGVLQAAISPRGQAQSLEDILIGVGKNMKKQVAWGAFLDKGKFDAKGYFSRVLVEGHSKLREQGFLEFVGASPRYETYRAQGFASPSGKLSLAGPISETSQAQLLPLLAGQVTPPPSEDNKFRLLVYTIPFQTPQSPNSKWAQETIYENPLWMNKEAALKLGLKDDDFVTVASARGSLKVRVRLIQGLHPRTVAIARDRGHTAYGVFAIGEKAPRDFADPDGKHIFWREEPKGVNIAALVPLVIDRFSGAAAWQETVVTITRG